MKNDRIIVKYGEREYFRCNVGNNRGQCSYKSTKSSRRPCKWLDCSRHWDCVNQIAITEALVAYKLENL